MFQKNFKLGSAKMRYWEKIGEKIVTSYNFKKSCFQNAPTKDIFLSLASSSITDIAAYTDGTYS